MLEQIMNTPWKFFNKLASLLVYPWVRVLFLLHAIPWKIGWQFYGVPIIFKHRQSVMRFGKNLQLRSSLRSNPLGVNHPVILATLHQNSQLIIGDQFAMSGGCICVAEKVTIGNNVAIGANSTIVDTDFHPLSSDLRAANPQDGKSKPVTIEDDVFIGMNCLIVKGVTIGKGSVIGANSVVTRDIPAGSIAAGNPAQVVRAV